MPRDVLEQLLTTLDVHLHAFAVCDVEGARGLAFEPTKAVILHYVLMGRGVLTVDNGPSLPFGPRSVLIVPPGHALGLSSGDGPAEALVAASESCRMLADGMLTFHSGERVDLRTACGTITATYAGGFGLFDHLAQPVIEDVADIPAVESAFGLMLQEMTAPAMGTRAIVEALMKQSLLMVLRRRLSRFETQAPMFAALRDPRLVRAVAAVLARPGARHTLQSLATEAGMSRSVFAQRFVQVFAQTPFEFLQKARLRKAARMLAVTDLPVSLVAKAAGFESRSHFSRVFRTGFGVSPSTYREMRASDEALIDPPET